MLGTCDDVILKGFADERESLAETGYANREILMAFGMLLGIDERFRIDNIELYVGKTHFRGGNHRVGQKRDIAL